MKIRLGHSPDADDAFMYYALSTGKINTKGIQFEQVIQDIQSLNEGALEGKLEVTAISAHAYPLVQKIYSILPCGASMGIGYGPILVARKMDSRRPVHDKSQRVPLNFSGKTIAIPGKLTTAYLLLKIYGENFEEIFVPFDEIFSSVQSGKADWGLVIHEGQLTYSDYGLVKIADLGKIWYTDTRLPLPLGVNVIRKDLGKKVKQKVARAIQQSIAYALTHRKDSFAFALRYGHGIPPKLGKKFILRYVNSYTLSMGKAGKKALGTLFRKAEERKLLPPVHSLQ